MRTPLAVVALIVVLAIGVIVWRGAGAEPVILYDFTPPAQDMRIRPYDGHPTQPGSLYDSQHNR